MRQFSIALVCGRIYLRHVWRGKHHTIATIDPDGNFLYARLRWGEQHTDRAVKEWKLVREGMRVMRGIVSLGFDTGA